MANLHILFGALHQRFSIPATPLNISTFKWTNSNRKRMLSDYVIHMKLRYSLSCIWARYMQSPAYTRPHLDTKKQDLKKNLDSSFLKEDLLWEMYLIRTARSDMALFSREDHFCHLYLSTLVNVLFLHKPLQIVLVGLFQTEMYCLTFKLFCYSDILLIIFYLLTKEGYAARTGIENRCFTQSINVSLFILRYCLPLKAPTWLLGLQQILNLYRICC